MQFDTVEILTLVLVLITAFYAWATFGMLKVSKASVSLSQQQFVSMSRPYIVVGALVHPGNPTIFLQIENTGASAALSLKLDLSRDFHAFGNARNNIRDYNAFSKCIDAFPPRAKLTFFLGVGFNLLSEKNDPNVCPLQFSVISNFTHAGINYQEETPVDLRMYNNTALAPDELTHQAKEIADKLGQIHQDLQRINVSKARTSHQQAP